MLKMQRTTWLQNWTPSTTGTNDFWRYYQFTLQQITNFTEMAALFDQYKMYALKYTFVPRYDSFAGNDTTDTTLPGVTNQGGVKLHIVKDPFSVVGPTGTYTSANLNSFLEQGNRVKTYSGNRNVSVFFRTTVNQTVEGTNTNRVRAVWLNTTQTNIAHSGFHVFAQDVNLTGVFGQSFDVFVTAYLMLRNVR